MQLLISLHTGDTRTIPLTSGTATTVGRGAECVIQLADPSVSRVQFELRVEEERVWLKDSNSRFGTFVNGVKTTECELRQGDVVRVGETTLRLDDGSAGLRTTIAPTLEQRDEAMTASLAKFSAPYNRGREQLAHKFVPRQLIGRRYGRFEMSALLAETPRGAMFRARDTNLRVDVALKIFSPDSMKGSAVARLEQAVKATISLAHPHLIAVYESGHDEGLNWISSEYVEGENAAEVIRRIGIAGMLDWRQSLKAAIHVARALQFIGQHQIAHRNISPQGILFRKRDGVVKLGDLVLAKALNEDASARLTRAGEIVGDLPYCSPEQVSGRTIDERSDQYNLGATLYALLTGRPPCEGRSFAETLDKIQSQPPQPPTTYHLAIPPLFEGVVLRTLAKRPEDRFTNAAALLLDLERVAKYLGETVLL